MQNFILAATTATTLKETIGSPEYVSYITTAISSIITGVVTYALGKKRATKSEFTELVAANSKFRDEIKKDLDEAKKTIEGLQKTLEEKGRIMDEMQMAISDLKQQIISKETKISDMQMDIIKKDYQIQMLKETESKNDTV